MNKKILALCSALAVGSFCFSTANAAEKPVGIPNPMVSYDTVEAAKAAAGFQPLYLPSVSGYHVSQVWVVAGDVIDIEYLADGQTATRFRLRTARCTEQMNEDISGLYGVKWHKKTIAGLPVSVATVPAESKAYPDGYAAHWQHNNMLFSISAENIGQPEFMHLLASGLVELSKNYF
ncbi:hypothetical protein SAMN05216582_10584 [Selenomonas ruminantium]|uniref:Lipoprotein n=1 Tax=Selenomonas ruminantium TaxID=971 RepID=A0A1M6SV40_SELRU|nr:hypothetical protein [Selenomonas ruminantium]SHK48448.1 hypothetical protein SAMN05216582_10584 [Selenomonas ruminantium]